MAEECAWTDPLCNLKEGVGEALTGAAGDALEQIADGVTSAVVETLASLSAVWTKIDSATLVTNTNAPIDAPVSGAFNAQMATALGYASWIGLALAVFSVMMLGITLAVNARRGDGTGMVTTSTMVFGGAALIGGATSLVSFLVPTRQTDITGTVGFIQDQTLYLTLGLAALSTIVAGVKIGWTQRGEYVRDLLRSLLTLALISAGGVVLVNVLIELADALAVQIIDSAIGEDFQSDLVTLLGMDNALTSRQDELVWMGGNVILIIFGGLLALLINLVQIMLMALRTGMLFLMAGILPLSAAFTNTEMGRNFFLKVIAWTVAFIFYKPAAAVIYAVAIKMSTSGVWEDGGNLITFAGGLMMIAASVFALPMLIGFLSPIMGAVSGSGGGGSAAVTGVAAAIPAGAATLSRGGRGFSGGKSHQASQGAGTTAESGHAAAGAGKAAGGAGMAAAGAATGGVGAALAAGAKAAGAAKDAVTESVASSVGNGGEATTAGTPGSSTTGATSPKDGSGGKEGPVRVASGASAPGSTTPQGARTAGGYASSGRRTASTRSTDKGRSAPHPTANGADGQHGRD